MPNPISKATIQFGSGSATSLEELGGAPQQNTNFLRDAVGWMRLFPGTSAWSWFPSTIPNASSVIGITDFNGKVVYVTADRKAWVVEAPGLVTALSTSSLDTQLEGGERPVFARTRSRLWIAGGGRLSYWDGTSTLARPDYTFATNETPLSASHVVSLNERLVAPRFDTSGFATWTEVFESTHLTGWNPLNFLFAAARPDQTVAAHANGGELFFFGAESVECWSPDTTGFAFSGAVDLGCKASYSIIPLYDRRQFAWLTPQGEFVMSAGRPGGQEYPSDPAMAKTLRDLTTLDDCFGYRVKILQHDLLVWTFPTLGITYHYNVGTQSWGDLRGFAAGAWTSWPITSYHFWEARGVHLVGLATGEVVVLDPSSYTVAGQAIRGVSDTGFFDHGSMNRKQSQRIRLPMRRGLAASAATENITLKYRDGTGTWGAGIPLSVGLGGDYRPYVEKRVVGRTYVKRAWRLEAQSVATTIGPMEEVFELLGD